MLWELDTDEVISCNRGESGSEAAAEWIVDQLSYNIGAGFSDSDSDIFGDIPQGDRSNNFTSGFVEVSLNIAVVVVSVADTDLNVIGNCIWQRSESRHHECHQLPT